MEEKTRKKGHIFLILIILFIQILTIKGSKIGKLNKNSEIIITINGSGIQGILNQNFNTLPYEILVNDNQVNQIDFYVYNLIDQVNNVTLRWNKILEDCSNMFKELKNITKINLSNFNSSKVKSMLNMFFNCESLTSIDISNLDTSLVTTMHAMFSRCYLLKSINLENLNTSSLTKMGYMFSRCRSLISLNLNHLNTSLVKNMNNMFYECKKLQSLYINEINTSSVIDMNNMFNGCNSLLSLDIINFNTSSVVNMSFMFNNCSSLTSLDLYFFNTSSVINMKYMFYNCASLKLLDLNNFDTSYVTDMRDMFSRCNSLISLYINNFDTSQVTDMSFMFNGSNSLLSLNLDNFNISNAQINSMFKDCKSLLYLNIDNFKPRLEPNMDNKMDNTFFNCESLISLNLKNFNISYFEQNTFPNNNHNNIIYCINTTNLSSNQFLSSLNINCSNNCFENIDNKIIYGENKCIDNCTRDIYHKYEYNNICYETCPNGTHNSDKNEYICEKDLICSKYYNYNHSKCLNYIPDGFYLNDSNLKTISKCDNKCKKCLTESNKCILCNTNENYYPKYNNILNENQFDDCYNEKPESFFLDTINNVYKSCYPTCKNCNELGDKNNHKCTECFNDYIKYGSNCYKRCAFYYYFDLSNEYHCTVNNECPKEYNKLILDKKKCIKNCKDDEIYKYDYNNICYNKYNEFIQECLSSNFHNGICKINNKNNIESKDEIIQNIENEIINHSMDSIITNIVEGEQKDLLIEDDNILFQITSTENQKHNKNENLSTIILGKCEEILKKVYNINPNLSLIIFKIDYFQPGSLIPIIGYEIFHPVNKSKLDLNYCKKEIINFNIPVSIEEDNLFKYDPNNEYYTDHCFPYTTDNGTDIILNDRHDEYNNNNLTLCENNCIYIGYENKTKNSKCDCEIKTKQLVISELINKTDVLSYNFENKEETSNFNAMKCYYTLFSKDGLYKNIENYVLLSIIALFIISGILFQKCGFHLLEEDIKEIISLKKEKKSDTMNLETIEIKNDKNKVKYTNTKIKKKTKIKIKKTFKIKRKVRDIKNINNNNIHKSSSKIDFKNNNDFILSNKNLNFNDIINKEKVNNSKDNYNDYELNTLSYKEAIKNDERKFSSYYISLIKTKQIVLFSFFPMKDYNSRIIKIDLFLLYVAISYFVNALFFDESMIHKIYKEKGKYNFKFLIRYIIFSFIIVQTTNIIIKKIFLSEGNISEIKKEKTIEKANDKVESVKRCLIIKYICFFIIGTVFLLFLWYYLSSFGSVLSKYTNIFN